MSGRWQDLLTITVARRQDSVPRVGCTAFGMGAAKPQLTAGTSEAIELLRESWRCLQTSQRLINQARLNPTDAVVMAGLLVLALEHAKKSQVALKKAADLIFTTPNTA